jgi:hypothetical protein
MDRLGQAAYPDRHAFWGGRTGPGRRTAQPRQSSRGGRGMTEIRMGRYSLSITKNTCYTARIVKYDESLTATVQAAVNADCPADQGPGRRSDVARDRSTGHFR